MRNNCPGGYDFHGNKNVTSIDENISLAFVYGYVVVRNISQLKRKGPPPIRTLLSGWRSTIKIIWNSTVNMSLFVYTYCLYQCQVYKSNTVVNPMEEGGGPIPGVISPLGEDFGRLMFIPTLSWEMMFKVLENSPQILVNHIA